MPIRSTKNDSDKRKEEGNKEAKSNAESDVKSNVKLKQDTNRFNVLSASSDRYAKVENDFLQFRPVFKRLKDLPAVRPGTPFRAPLRAKGTRHEDGEKDGPKGKKKHKPKEIAQPIGSKVKLLSSKASPLTQVQHVALACANLQCKQKFQHRSQMIEHVNYECWYTKLNCLKCERDFHRMHYIAHQRVCRIASMEELSTTSELTGELNSERTTDAPDLCSRDELKKKKNLGAKLLDLTWNQMLPNRRSNDSLESTSETSSKSKGLKKLKAKRPNRLLWKGSQLKESQPNALHGRQPDGSQRIKTVSLSTKVLTDKKTEQGKKTEKAKSQHPGSDRPLSQPSLQPSVNSVVSRDSALGSSKSMRLSATMKSHSMEGRSTNYRANDRVRGETEPKLVHKDAPKLRASKKSSSKLTKGCNVS